jgi:hypothetical protein
MAKTLALVFGIVFIVVGILGFIPNPIVGHDALFHTNSVHNLVHLIIGIVLLIGAGAGEGLSKNSSFGDWSSLFTCRRSRLPFYR